MNEGRACMPGLRSRANDNGEVILELFFDEGYQMLLYAKKLLLGEWAHEVEVSAYHIAISVVRIEGLSKASYSSRVCLVAKLHHQYIWGSFQILPLPGREATP